MNEDPSATTVQERQKGFHADVSEVHAPCIRQQRHTVGAEVVERATCLRDRSRDVWHRQRCEQAESTAVLRDDAGPEVVDLPGK